VPVGIFLNGILKNKKMPHRPYLRLQGPVQWNAPVSSLKYIGPYYTGILQTQNIIRIIDVVRYFSMRTAEALNEDIPERYLFIKFAELTRNQNAQMCKGRYNPRPINRMAFNALVNLVDYAYHNPQEFDNPDFLEPFYYLDFDLAPTLLCSMNEGQGPSQDDLTMCDKVQLMGNVGDEPEILSMRNCPCINDINACNGDCVWSEDACISRIANYDNRNYAPDIPPYSGDWYPLNGQPPHIRPGTRYVNAGQNRVGKMFAIGADEQPVGDDDNNYGPFGSPANSPPSPPGSPDLPPPSPPNSPPYSPSPSPPGSPGSPGPADSPPPVPAAQGRRPFMGRREVTPDMNIQRGSRRPRRSLRQKNKKK
jgi:hypothetical protein